MTPQARSEPEGVEPGRPLERSSCQLADLRERGGVMPPGRQEFDLEKVGLGRRLQKLNNFPLMGLPLGLLMPAQFSPRRPW